MGNVFPYMFMSEAMRIVVPREIVKRNVHTYHPRRVLVLRFLLHPLSFYTSCNALAPFVTMRTPRPSSRPAQYLPVPAHKVFFFLGPYSTWECVPVIEYFYQVHLLPFFPYTDVSSLVPCFLLESNIPPHASQASSLTHTGKAGSLWMNEWVTLTMTITLWWGERVKHGDTCSPYLAAPPSWPVLVWLLEEWLL